MMAEVGRVLADFRSGACQVHGIIYAMYAMERGQPSPLYLGKSEKFGKQGSNLSANLTGIKVKGQHPFARWGYNYAYHMGDLSCVVLNHPETPALKYVRWAEALFEKSGDRFTTRLKRPVYFWVRAWQEGDVGPWRDFGATSLTFLEYLLIGVTSTAFPSLLNEEGVNR